MQSLNAQFGTRTDDCRRHLIASEIIQANKADVSRHTKGRMPRQKIDHGGSRIAIDAAESQRAVIRWYAPSQQPKIEEVKHSQPTTRQSTRCSHLPSMKIAAPNACCEALNCARSL